MPEDRRRSLLDEMARAVLVHGYQGASLNTVLEAAGVAKSSFYHRFADKEALFRSVVEDRLEVFSARVPLPEPSALEASTFWPALDEVLANLTRAAVEEPRTREFGRLADVPDAPPVPALESATPMLADWTVAMLDRGRLLGCIETETPQELHRALAVQVALVIDRWAVQAGPAGDPAATASRLLRRLLAP